MKIKNMAYWKAKNGIPLKQRKDSSNSPLHQGWLDKMQYGLTAAGMIPGIGNIADLANTAVSGGRAAYSKYKGDDKAMDKHLANMAINASSAIPIVGQGVAGTKLAKGALETGKVVAKDLAKRTGKTLAKKEIGDVIDKT